MKSAAARRSPSSVPCWKCLSAALCPTSCSNTACPPSSPPEAPSPYSPEEPGWKSNAPKNILHKDTQTLLVIFILRVTRTQNMWRRIFLPCLRQQHTFCQKLIVCVGWSIFLGRNQCTVQLMKQEAVQRLNKTRTSSYLTFHTDDQMLRRKLDLSAEALSFNHQFSDRKSDVTLTKSLLSPKSAANNNFLSVK